MKTILKSLFVAAVCMGVGTTLHAQPTSLGTTQQVTVNARVLKKIVISNLIPVTFGASEAGGPLATLDPKSQASNVNVGFIAKPGKITIEASPNEQIRVEFPITVPLDLLDGDGNVITGTGSNQIFYVPEIAGEFGTVAGDYGGATAVLLGNDVPPANTVTATTSGGLPSTGRGPFLLFQTSSSTTPADRTTFFIGGRLTPSANTASWSGFNTLNSAGTPPAIESTNPTGTFRGTLTFNFLYAN
jgi:hypothetical protein